MKNKTLSDLFTTFREKRPLVHHITNYVTVNDCANITIAAGAAPVMADAPEEVCEMVNCAGALVLRHRYAQQSTDRIHAACRRDSKRSGNPVILDPVGAGATRFRTESAQRLLEELKITVLKGNPGEIGVLAGAEAYVRGVDSHGVNGDLVTIAGHFAKRAGITVVVSGPVDIVTDGTRIFLVENGHPMLGCISGTGCMAASLTGAFAAAADDPVNRIGSSPGCLGDCG